MMCVCLWVVAVKVVNSYPEGFLPSFLSLMISLTDTRFYSERV